MNSFTWHREKHSLFDTEAKNDKLSRKVNVARDTIYITRKDNEVETGSQDLSLSNPSLQHLLKVVNI